MKNQNRYEQLFDQFMELIEFGLIKHNDNNDDGIWSVRDYQDANLGDIESDRFNNAMQIFDRMEIYIEDYFLRDIDNLLAEKDIVTDFMVTYDDYLQNARELLPEAAWDFEVLDMICNHFNEINLNNCYYEEAEMEEEDEL